MRRLGSVPLIRFYQWSQPSISLGYFEKIDRGAEQILGRISVGCDVGQGRRGGSSSRRDLRCFYSSRSPVGRPQGSELSRMHSLVAEMYRSMGLHAELIEVGVESESVACFEKPGLRCSGERWTKVSRRNKEEPAGDCCIREVYRELNGDQLGRKKLLEGFVRPLKNWPLRNSSSALKLLSSS